MEGRAKGHAFQYAVEPGNNARCNGPVLFVSVDVAAKDKKVPKYMREPDAPAVRANFNPQSYLEMRPVWRFSYFDWDSRWGVSACAEKNWRKHIETHLAAIETMTWAEILQAAGGKRDGNGTNSHPLARRLLCKEANERLQDRGIHADPIFSLRLENTIRVYGVRDLNCLNIIWFDPFHENGNKAAIYEWT